MRYIEVYCIPQRRGKESNALSIASDIIRGHTDAIILARLSAGDSYGYEINKAILRKTNGRYELKEATLYTAFKRLEESGSITSYWGERGHGRAQAVLCHNGTGQEELRGAA